MRFRVPTLWQRIAIVLLALWGAGLILPEFVRVVDNYGKLGFTADNDGVITSVDGPPATDSGLKRGDCIDLGNTERSELLAVFGSMGGMVYVRPDRVVTLKIARAPCNVSSVGTDEVHLEPRVDPLTPAHKTLLLATQLSALFFIWIAAALVWQQPSGMTWGFFLYAIWFNPGQWFVAYAELERHAYWLIPQQVAQAFAEALGYAGFVEFALRFPHNRVEPRWRWIENSLPAVVALLVVLQIASFGTMRGLHVEAVSRWSYWAGYAIDIAVLFILRFRRRTQSPEDQQRTRWVHWGCRVGLLSFIFADSNMATSAWAPLWDVVCPTRVGQLVCDETGVSEPFLLFFYLLNATVALAVFHAVRTHRVLDVRFALSRGATLLATSFVVASLLTVTGEVVEHYLASVAGRVFVYIPLVAVLKMGFERLHRVLNEWCDAWFFKRLHAAERRLRDAAAALMRASCRDDIDEHLTREVALALDVASAAIFRLEANGRYRRAADAIGWSDAHAHAFAPRESLLRQLARSGRALPLHRSDLDDTMPHGSAQPYLALPIEHGGALGTIVLYGARAAGDRLSDDELELLNALAYSAGPAYERVEALGARAALGTQAAD